MLAPGYPGRWEYWDDLGDERWRSVAAPRNASLRGSELEDARTFWQTVRDDIGAAAPRSSFLLVDTPSGMTDLTTVACGSLADAVVVLVNREDDVQKGAALLLAWLVELRHVELHLAETRFPEHVEPRKERESRQRDLLEFFGDRIKPSITSVSTLRAQLGMEAAPTEGVALRGPVKLTPLVRDYFGLAARLFPEQVGAEGISGPVVTSDDWSSSVESVKRALERNGMPCEETGDYKVFERDQRGAMRNLMDLQRNVSFKVETLCGVFADLVEETGASEKVAANLLRKAGHRAGSRFGSAMLSDVWDGHPPDSLRQRVEAWCRFDSDVGFGHLEFVAPTAGDDIGTFEIHVYENFLARGGAHDRDVPLCEWLVGYVGGVIAALTGGETKVAHDALHCIRRTEGVDACVFAVTVT